MDELENKIFEHSSKTIFQIESVGQKEFVEDAKQVLSKNNRCLSANVSVEVDTNVNSHCKYINLIFFIMLQVYLY